MALNDRLAAFLRCEAARPWGWDQEHDCGLWLADWFVAATGRPDPAAQLRGTYHSEASCKALYGAAPAARMIRIICTQAALLRTTSPVIGDIAVLAVRTGPAAKERADVGAIRVSQGWVIPAASHTGLTRPPDIAVRMLAAWRIEESYAATPSVPG